MIYFILVAVSCAAYQHTGSPWLLYLLYTSAALALCQLMSKIATWPKYIGDSIVAHGDKLKFTGHNKEIRVNHTGDIRHSGNIRKG
jgi:hypothetical protein